MELGVVAIAPAAAAIFTMCGAALHVVPDPGLTTVQVGMCDEPSCVVKVNMEPPSQDASAKGGIADLEDWREQVSSPQLQGVRLRG